MKCGYPVEIGQNTVNCGRCMPCRINKKQMWTGRLILENSAYKNTSTFLTMTYDQENVPRDGTLVPEHLNDYINRLRGSSLGHFRYFAVGEYGDKTERPHYHMAIFNAPPEHWEEYFQKRWPYGFTKAGEITQKSAAYIAGYCTKKMTNHDDERLDGRHPEFTRMSKKPPLGDQGMRRILETLYTRSGSTMLAKLGDVPKTYRIDGRLYPVSKYYVEWMRQELGIEKPNPAANWEVSLEEISRQEKEQARKNAEKLYRRRGRAGGI